MRGEAASHRAAQHTSAGERSARHVGRPIRGAPPARAGPGCRTDTRGCAHAQSGAGQTHTGECGCWGGSRGCVRVSGGGPGETRTGRTRPSQCGTARTVAPAAPGPCGRTGSTREPSWPCVPRLGQRCGPRAGQRTGPGSREGQGGADQPTVRAADGAYRSADGPGTSTGGPTAAGRKASQADGRPDRKAAPGRRASPAVQRVSQPTAPAVQRAGGQTHRPGRSTSGADGRPRQSARASPRTARAAEGPGGSRQAGKTGRPTPRQVKGQGVRRPVHGLAGSAGGPRRVKKAPRSGRPWLRPRWAGGRGR